MLAGLVAGLLPAARRRRAPSPERTGAAPPGAVVVASFNFAESALVAEMYSLALERAGVPVRREPRLGPRELVHPALFAGLVDVVPEYLGTAAASVAPGAADPADAQALRRALVDALEPRGAQVLEPAPAQNQNGFAVLRSTAERLGVLAVSDLAPLAGRLTLGGPPECPRRPFCGEGLATVYGVHFARFLPFEGEQQRIAALQQEVVDVAVVFSTDGHLATGEVVLLEDDRRLQPAEHVVPVVSRRAAARHGAAFTGALDAVSSRLTSNSLTFLNWRVSVEGRDVAAEARGWLRREGLLPRPG